MCLMKMFGNDNGQVTPPVDIDNGKYLFVNGTTVTSGSGSTGVQTVIKTLYKFASLTSISAKVNNSELLDFRFAPGFC